MSEKLCPKCNRVKSYDDFHRNPKTSDGCATRCKVCMQEYSLARKRLERIGVTEKICIRDGCIHNGKPQNITNFYKSAHERDGHHYYCADCQREISATYQVKIRERIRQGDISLEKHIRQSSNIVTKESKQRYPERVKAQTAVMNAKAVGKLPRACSCTCADCGNQAQAYHHENYEPEHWLDVIPLCIKCHNKRHRKYK